MRKSKREKEAYEKGREQGKINTILSCNFSLIAGECRVKCNTCGKELLKRQRGWIIKHYVKHLIYK